MVIDPPDNSNTYGRAGLSDSQAVIRVCSYDDLDSKILHETSWIVEPTSLRLEVLKDDVVEPSAEELEARLNRYNSHLARFFSSEYQVFIGAVSESGSHPWGWKDEAIGCRVLWTTNWLEEITADLIGEILSLPDL